MRTTSIYLPYKVKTMLPPLLCQMLCSLNPNLKRLAFSIVFKIRENGEIIKEEKPRVFKSIIKSCAKLSYQIAQNIIDHKINNLEDFPEKFSPKGLYFIFLFFIFNY